MSRATRLSITVWLHKSSGGGDHYTVRAYRNDGKVVGSIHVGEKDEDTKGWFGDEMKTSKKKKTSKAGRSFRKEDHALLGVGA
ncbi:hypothetical protein VKT23_014038 [Stygiomarasmius scandens]|uniref:Uncharacterized protein n=1 Tax=Marasmiellus scandens TaxID=2682957 RepID=A0ABR1J232_9AGAR